MTKKSAKKAGRPGSDCAVFVAILAVALLIIVVLSQSNKSREQPGNMELSFIANCPGCDDSLSSELARLEAVIKQVGASPVNSTKEFTMRLDGCAEAFDVAQVPSCPINCSNNRPVCWAIVAAGDCPRNCLMYKGCSGISGGIEIAPEPEVPCNFTKNMTLLIKKAGPNSIEITEA